MIGQTISHYKILEKLGEGGMGIVYKAHDTKLDRIVALKFLPREVSLSEEERNRFIHEAKAASALDHPNICTIYEVNETPDGQMFIAMGYYEGVSLNKKIQKGRLDLEEAVGISIQIAEGLQAAHEKGIVHRDIKSGNIIITEKGQVKILDFGLAHKSGLSRLTRTGTTVGTAPYMSPEQAKGEKVDERSDLWSLGVVLYEMVTGRLPFRGEHEAAILYSVVNEAPKPLEVSISGSSPELIHIIGRALEKDIAERYQTAAEMLVDLKRLKRETSSTGFQPIVAGTERSTRRRKWLMIGLGAWTTIAIAVVYLVIFLKPSTDINPDWKQHQIQIPLSGINNPAISADGNWIAFSACDHKRYWGLYHMNVMGGSPRLVTPLPFASWVDISADGSRLLYEIYNLKTNNLEWHIIYSSGGDSRRIIHGEGFAEAPRFRPDGKRVGYIWVGVGPSSSDYPEFWSVGIDGTDARREFADTLSKNSDDLSFCYSPDGKRIAWCRSFQGYAEILIHDLEGGMETQITSDKKPIYNLVWTREDKIVYLTDRGGIQNIWVVPAEGGSPVAITNAAMPVVFVNSSADGQKIIYQQQRDFYDFWIFNIKEKRSQQITFYDEAQAHPYFSPDGKKIAFTVYGEKDVSHIFVMDRDGKNRRQITFGEEAVFLPRWSPDGKRIAYGTRKVSEPRDSIRTYVVDLSNPTEPKFVARGSAGTWLDTVRVQVWVNGDTSYLASLDGVPPVRVYDDSTWASYVCGGKYIVYRDHRQGKDNTVWWIVDATKPREVQRKTARLLPWHSIQFKVTGDGKTLYMLRNPGEIWRMALPDGKEERIPGDFPGVTYNYQINLSWDGKEILITQPRFQPNVVMIENLFE